MYKTIGSFHFIGGHTEACRKRQAEQLAAHTAYITKWPDHCMICGGSGFICDETDETCECLTDATCPRCGKEIQGLTCLYCGFVVGQDDGCPPARIGRCACEYLLTSLEKNHEKV